MIASLSASGLVPMSAAIAGSEVAITVESMFSMNRATATISGTMRSRNMEGAAAGSWVMRVSQVYSTQAPCKSKAKPAQAAMLVTHRPQLRL